jgi:hypothetical protein
MKGDQPGGTVKITIVAFKTTTSGGGDIIALW